MKKKKTIRLHRLLIALLLFTHCTTSKQDNTVTDIDGYEYRTITIGKQIWMAENLRVTRYRNGDTIPNITDTTAWSTCTSGAYCNYNNDASHSTGYGRLYNWHAINDSRKIAPAGWHIPTDEEIASLEAWLENNPAAAGKINTNGLGGYRFGSGGTYHTMGFNGYWWSASRSFEMYDWSPRLFTGFVDVQRNKEAVTYGLAVRCIKD
ncbi:hypothetical protein FAM09_10540 [Niastella caeni]|uniref:Fibrobacter succinogenes major paralogous domain-containing protein n=1 Tax=Niastella caeni TaxID=2569763 RepID=A0A4V6T3U4_9BACT|nr:fibrobacter succinogenes major paralogous domain-containing protein [Niastella caeni]THU40296.1 hypothetical protein FAM09_10540 [Niastella caeni]